MSTPNSELGITPTVRQSFRVASEANFGAFGPREQELYGLIDRLDGLPITKHVPTSIIAYACSLSIIDENPFALVQHRPSTSVSEKTEILQEQKDLIDTQLGLDVPIEPLKTVTLRVNYGTPFYFLVSDVGDFRLDRQAKQDLAVPVRQLLLVEPDVNVMRETSINPPEYDPRSLGAEAGIVSPFVQTFGFFPIKAFLYYWRPDYEGYVALATSFTDTLIVKKSTLDLTVMWWQGHTNRIPLKVVHRGQASQVLTSPQQ